MKKQIILVMGLPGSGKTTFATKLIDVLGANTVKHFNADQVRQQFNDWDFTVEGRMRQARRMRQLADEAVAEGYLAVCDFVCPTEEAQELFDDTTVVWMNTIKAGRFEDTNKLFQTPAIYNYHITSWDYEQDLYRICYTISADRFDYTKPTVQMMGRYQPFHDGHCALFVEALKKTGQVVVMVRSMPQDDKNPFSREQTEFQIIRKLAPWLGKFQIQWVPNVVDISYGRDVGYTISKIELPEDIQAISATKIRKEMGLT